MRKSLFSLILVCALCGASAFSQQKPGSVDEAFNPGPILSGASWIPYPVFAMALQPDGRILLGGSLTNFDGHPVNGMVRLFQDGTFDPSFVFVAVEPSDAFVYEIVLTNDGQILISGNFGSVGGQPRPGLARLNSNGPLDGSFTPNPPPALSTGLLAVQGDGKVLLSVQNQIGAGLVRLNVDGSLDPSLKANVLGDRVVAAWPLDNGELLVGGWFTLVDGEFVNGLIRLNADGSLDHSFKAQMDAQDTLPPVVSALVFQPGGKIVIGGGYASVFGYTGSFIFRLNASDGSLDRSFAGGNLLEPATPVTSLVLQKDGKIVAAGGVGGDASSMQRISRVLMKRFNSDGSVDGSFGGGVTVEALDFPSINIMVAEGDGKLLVAGRFDSINAVSRTGFARIMGASIPALENPRRTANQISFSFLGLLPWTYQVEKRESLVSTNWVQVQTIPGDDTVKGVSNKLEGQQGFYRINASPKP